MPTPQDETHTGTIVRTESLYLEVICLTEECTIIVLLSGNNIKSTSNDLPLNTQINTSLNFHSEALICAVDGD